MLNEVKTWLLKQGYERFIPVLLRCPSCRASIQRPPSVGETGLDTIVTCPRCSWSGTIDTLIDSSPEEPEAVTEQPRDSKIALRVEPNLTRTWVFSPSGKVNFLLIFGLFWLTFIGFFTFLMVGSDEESFEGISKVGGILFLIPFWLVGLGTLTAGLWIMLVSQELSVTTDGRVFSARRFLGFTFRRKFEVGPQTRVKRVVLYTQNDSPVYAIEISNGKKDRIRLSGAMNDADKAWMLSQLRSALGKEEPANSLVPMESPTADHAAAQPLDSPVELRETFSDVLTIRRTGFRTFDIVLGFRFSIVFLIVAVAFLAATVFLGWESFDGFLSLDDSSFPVFDWLFIIVPGVMALIFGAIAIATLFFTVGMKGRKRTLKFYEDCVVTDPEWPLGISGGKFEKSQFNRVGMSRTGQSNGDPRYSVKLLGPGTALSICRFREAEEAGAMADWARTWLGS